MRVWGGRGSSRWWNLSDWEGPARRDTGKGRGWKGELRWGQTKCEMTEGPWRAGGRGWGTEAKCWVVALGRVTGDSRGWSIHWYVM